VVVSVLFISRMANDDEKQWRELCEQAAIETDHNKLVELADKINYLLERRENRLRETNHSPTDAKD
jgi:hypothetical protein